MSKSRLVYLVAFAALMGGCTETVDNFDSQLICQDYCSKKYACDEYNPTSDETTACVNSCRESIENECGNEHQAAVNDVIEGCVDMGCADFWGCMVFEAAPECLGFIEN